MARNSQEKGMGWRVNPAEQDRVLFEGVFPDAKRVLEEGKIKLEDFAGLYGDERIARDNDYVRTKKDEVESRLSPQEREAKREALIFEALFHEGVNVHGWLGDMARIVKTSDFDDWKNGVDGIVEFKEPDTAAQHLALAVDMTFSSQLAKKFEKIRDDILKGELARIDYFRSGNFRGELTNVPRVIVGIDRGHLVDIAREVFIRSDKARLLRHPIQILQLRQMALELDTFAEYAKRIGRKDIAETLRRDEATVRKILQTKSVAEGIRIGDWQDDKVFQAIQKELQAFV